MKNYVWPLVCYYEYENSLETRMMLNTLFSAHHNRFSRVDPREGRFSISSINALYVKNNVPNIFISIPMQALFRSCSILRHVIIERTGP